MGSLIHDCAEGSYQFWCRNKQFKVRAGGGSYRATREPVRVHYEQAPAVSQYEYVPQEEVIVYQPQVEYVPQVVYEPKVVYEVKHTRRAVVVPSHEYHTRPTYQPAPQAPVYEGPVTSTEETVYNDYDGHGVLVYEPKRRTHRREHRRDRKQAGHDHYQQAPAYAYGDEQPTQVVVVNRRKAGQIHKKTPLFDSTKTYEHKTYRQKVVVERSHKRVHRKYRRRAVHVRYRKQIAHGHYPQAPDYAHAGQQDVRVVVVKRRKAGRIHRKTPLFGTTKTYRHKIYRRTCSQCGHVVHKKRRH